MKAYLGLVKRNMLVFFKDKAAVFFSMLTPIIIFGLYILFLRGTFVSGIKSCMGEAINYISNEDIDAFANMILASGVIGSALITVSYACLTTIISDREAKIDYDISATPIKRPLIILSYITSAFITSFMISAVLLTAILLIVMKGSHLTAISVLALYGVTLLGALSATSFLMIFIMLFKTSSAAGTAQGIICAATGFIIGAYIPMSEFSAPVQTIANLFPGSHITALYRTILLDGVLNHMDASIGGLDNHLVVTSIKEVFTNTNMFNTIVSPSASVWYTVGILFSSIAVAALVYSRVYKRK